MKEKKTVIGILLAAIMLMAVGYAAFSTSLVINGTANIASSWKVVFTDILQVSKTDGVTVKETPTASGTTATFYVDLTSPGDAIEYKITVANQGTLPAIIESIEASETGSDAIKFDIANIKIGDKLAAKASTTFNITISYDESITTQPDITDNKLTIDVKYVQDLGQTITGGDVDLTPTRLYSKILAANTPKSDTNIDFSKSSAQDGTSGLYYTNTNTAGNNTTYYFRGDVDNNYVKFGKQAVGTCFYEGKEVYKYDDSVGENILVRDESTCLNTVICDVGSYYLTATSEDFCAYDMAGTVVSGDATWIETEEDIIWRIVRINEDGSIRMIKQDGLTLEKEQYSYNSIAGNASVGYMYGDNSSLNYADTHKNTIDSIIKDNVDKWYTKNLGSYSDYIADAGFCNDRSIASKAKTWAEDDTALGFGSNRTYYGAYNRIVNNKTPQFACPNESNDLFTLKASNKGNKALTNPIGLLTADEAVYAGAAMGVHNTTYYLENGNYAFTMTPDYCDEYGDCTIWSFGQLITAYVTWENYSVGDLRPVINLTPTVEVSEGNGLVGTPYVIKTN